MLHTTENEDGRVHRKGQDGIMVRNLYNSQLFLSFHDTEFIKVQNTSLQYLDGAASWCQVDIRQTAKSVLLDYLWKSWWSQNETVVGVSASGFLDGFSCVCVRARAHARMFSFSNSDLNPPPHWLRRSPSVLPFFPQATEIVRSSNGESGGRKENERDKHVGGDAWMDGWEEWVDEVRREQCGSEGGVEGGWRLQSTGQGILASSPWTGPQQTPAVTRPALPGSNQSFFTSNKIFLAHSLHTSSPTLCSFS